MSPCCVSRFLKLSENRKIQTQAASFKKKLFNITVFFRGRQASSRQGGWGGEVKKYKKKIEKVKKFTSGT
jgi:hypothetical protein